MTIKLFPNSERIDLTEDKTTAHSGYETYTGVVFDTEKNAFKVVSGKFRDKKDMYEKMTKQNKYLRRAYEAKIWDWIQDNAETALDGYLMLSTAVSKWKNNNILSKYYKKLLHDLPYINREGRKGDPQTMGIKASFESVMNKFGKTLLEDDNEEEQSKEKADLASIDEFLFKTFKDEAERQDLPTDKYTVRIGAKSNAETPVHDVNTGEIIGKITSKVVKNEEGNPYNIAVDNNGNQIGYAFFPAGKVFSSLDKNSSEVVGNFTRFRGDSNFISPKNLSDFTTFSNVPGFSYYFDKVGTPNSILKNPLITLRLAQAIKANIIDNDNKGAYKVIVTDRKGDEVANLSLAYSEIMSAIRNLSQTYKTGEYVNTDRKNQEPIYMSDKERQERELQQAYDTASRPGNIAHQADMFTGIANSYDRLNKLKKDQNREDRYYRDQLDTIKGLADIDNVNYNLDKELGRPSEEEKKAKEAIKAADTENRVKDIVTKWNELNKPLQQPEVKSSTYKPSLPENIKKEISNVISNQFADRIAKQIADENELIINKTLEQRANAYVNEMDKQNPSMTNDEKEKIKDTFKQENYDKVKQEYDKAGVFSDIDSRKERLTKNYEADMLKEIDALERKVDNEARRIADFKGLDKIDNKTYENALHFILNPNAETQEESVNVQEYVNDGANTLKQWTDATYVNSASFQEASTHNELNQTLFDGKKLKDDVREALIEIANSFKDTIDLVYEPVDIYFTGSEANYNYNEHSDIDVHLVYDFEQVGGIAEMINHYLQTAKRVFNDKHQITVKGLPVEVGAEMKGSPLVTSGVYSLVNDEWVIEPENANKEISEPTKPYYDEVKLRIEDAITSKDFNKIKDTVDFIWGIRKEGLANEGEFGPANTLFKQLRNEGLLGELRQSYYDAESEELSLESAMQEAEFASKEEANKTISNDLFDKSEEEILDGLMDHYENKDDAIAKVEDVIKNSSDGYKDKLQNVITKIKENYTFSNKCKRIVEKAMNKLTEENNVNQIIKTLGQKLATSYLKNYSDGDFKIAFDKLQNDKKDLKEITDLKDSDLKDLESLNMTLERVTPAIYTAAVAALQSEAKEKQFLNDYKIAKDNTPYLPSKEERYKRANALKAPSNFTVDSFINLFKNEADLQIYLDIIRGQFPIALLDHSRKFYLVTDDGKRIILRGIEKGLYPQNVWVNEVELEPTGTKIGYFNGEKVMDANTNKAIGYADGKEAYTNDGKFLGYLDRDNNVISPYGQYAHKEFWPVAAYSMPIEEYRRILYSPKNALTLEDAIETTQEELAKAGFDYSFDDTGNNYNQVKNIENMITRDQARWELNHIDDLKINHYDKMIRDLIYYKIVKKHMDPAEVMREYEKSYKEKPYYKPTEQVVNQLNPKKESTEEITEADDNKWYTFSKKGNVAVSAKEYLEDMHIPSDEYFDAILNLQVPGSPFHGGNYKFSAITSNPNEDSKIVSQNPVFSNASIRPDNYVYTYVDGTEKIIGYSPLPRFDQYVENPSNYYNRPVYGFVDKDHTQMQLEGILKGWENNEVFKLIPVDNRGKRDRNTSNGEQHLTIKEMFDVLKLPQNARQIINSSRLEKSDANSATHEREQLISRDQNGQWIDLDDSEVLEALKYVMSKNNKGTANGKPYQEIINDFENDSMANDDVMKMLRLVDPRKTEFIKRQPHTGNVQIYVAYANGRPTPTKYIEPTLVKAAKAAKGLM